MCKALRDLEKDWKQEGIEKGIEQTLSCLEKLKQGISNSELVKMGYSDELIRNARKFV